MAALTNYLENKVLDWLLRGQAFTPPATVYVALFIASPSDAGGGTEVSGGSYARVAIASNMTNWSGTQGAGTTTASTGTSGTISNNSAITYPAPTANWGVITSVALMDSLTGGNMLAEAVLQNTKTVNNGDTAPSFAAGSLQFQLDD